MVSVSRCAAPPHRGQVQFRNAADFASGLREMPQSRRLHVTFFSPRFFAARSAAMASTACSKFRPSYLPELTHTPPLYAYHSCQQASVKTLSDAETASTM